MATKIIAASAATPKPTTAEQRGQVLEHIAGQTATLCELIRLVQADEESAATALDAALIVAVSIGAQADAAVGSCIIGDAETWHYGPSYATAGQEVSHG